MYKLALALIIIASAQFLAFGKRLNNAALRKTRDSDSTRAKTMEPKGRKSALNSRTPRRVTFQSGVSLLIVKGPDRVGQKYYDPNKSGNPLLDTGGSNRSKMLSDNFSVDEVARSGNKTFDKARIDPRHIECLQAVRDYVGKPVLIRSGYRSFWYNIEVYRRMGKQPTRSQHSSGRASDIKVEGMTGLEIAKVAIDVCNPNVAIGLGLGYVHIDLRNDASIWRYDGVNSKQVAEVEHYRITKRLAMKRRARRQRRVNS